MKLEKEIDFKQGLSYKEVSDKKAKGLSNNPPKKVTKTNGQIVYDNVCTLFNFLNFAIGVALLSVGAISNMFYLLIILMNIGIGIYQEIHAKNLVEKLTLISADKAGVVREGKVDKVALEDIVMDDILYLEMGDQIPADAIVVNESVEVNESLLTGESDTIVKKVGDELFSGSFIVGGRCQAQVIRVGDEAFANKIVSEVKEYKKNHSELIQAIRTVSKFTSFIIIPLGLILFYQAFVVRENTMFVSIVASAAALLGMLPKGLVLLIGIGSATGVINLSKRNVLVQDMHCMEIFAHVDMLCLDKTGTITEGNMRVVKAFGFQGKNIDNIMANYIEQTQDNNATFQAMHEYFFSKKEHDYQAGQKIPFSSERKWGSIDFLDLGVVKVGAPEKMCDPKDIPNEVHDAQADGFRVLMVSLNDEPLGAICLDDPIRENAKATFDFFKREGVEVKVISGDHPLTVANVARKAGLEGWEAYVDLSQVTDEAKVRKLAHTHKVFGRVSPEQKRCLVNELRNMDHIVAMSGDGVNDVLALKEANCSIAMANGNAAAKQVSQLVLLDSDFSNLTKVLSEGRRIINNVTKVSGIFFIKTIYSLLLSLLCIVMNIPFPFIPIQITLIDLAIEGFPSFFISFEENNKQVTGTYLKTSLLNALPNALLIIMNIIIVLSIKDSYGFNDEQATAIMYMVVGAISILAVLKACLPFNKLRLFLFWFVAIGFYVAVVLFHSLLKIPLFTTSMITCTLLLVVLSIVLYALYQWILYKKTHK
ncbi:MULTISPECIES: HAD-IC family P-type ATPase [unclassified Breznakia]|uniref:HAD-IC family P-type ATPase n=1 Tax=unclassified Breznakia TaxID=2623764 RepID=UPI002472EB27|nr:MULTISPECIES: HAD-IC family P-type ATPase [unclassified Breznakia]MDH6367422.1 cation-transporting ATPase E [Breznakia sp. PH1-1]MDH6403954.1 cation-transporting ATPase E [Breznakia sp. PF1-11]MDH6411663.1 cation-transporting ATPase E [Breznakia sp. PFB1-11]MDH6414589.1 cation-transporting ATPase E [Breznakia sp. PFB1-14]MDH6416014.1 cation-transporting ATPase E [Breznakia sp. PFB1-4]